MGFEGSPTLSSGTFQNAGGVMGFLGQTGAQTLTISSGVVVHGYGTLGEYVFVGGSGGQNIINQGVIDGDVSGQTLATNSQVSSFTNSGTLTATGGGGVNIGALTGNLNVATVTGSGSRVILAGTYVNNLGLTAPAGTTLELDGSWSSTSTLNVNGGTVNFGGAFTTAAMNLAQFTRTGGAVNITGTLDNSSTGPLNLNATTGSWTLSGGVISGGTINESGGAALGMTTSSGNRLVNVQVNGDVAIGGGSLRIGGTFGSTGIISLTGGGQLGFEGSPTLSSGTVQLAGGIMGFYGQTGAQTLTIGSGVVVHGYGTLGQYVFVGGSGGQIIVNQGVIDGDVSGQTLATSSQVSSFTNSGTLDRHRGAAG